MNDAPYRALLDQAIRLTSKRDTISSAVLQRLLKVDYLLAKNLIDDLEDKGLVGPADGAMPRKVLSHEAKHSAANQMSSHLNNRPMSEEERRLVRAGYYRKHDKIMQEDMFNELSEEQISYYKNYKEPFTRKFKDFLIGLAGLILILGLWTSPIWIAVGWSWLFPSQGTTSQSNVETQRGEDSNCNPNYSPCIPNASYDLDCADVGKSVRVIGYDEYGLDRDGDGRGCDRY